MIYKVFEKKIGRCYIFCTKRMNLSVTKLNALEKVQKKKKTQVNNVKI